MSFYYAAASAAIPPSAPTAAALGVAAWYDFAGNANDSHSGAYHLTPVGGPSYVADADGTYGVSEASGSKLWTQAAIDAVWGAIDEDLWFYLRFRAHTGFADYDTVFNINGTRTQVRMRTPTTGPVRADIVGTGTTTNARAGALGVWYSVFGQYDKAADQVRAYLNNGTPATAAAVQSFGAGDLHVGGADGTNAKNFHVDTLILGKTVPTTDQRAWLYNSGGTRVYSDLAV